MRARPYSSRCELDHDTGRYFSIAAFALLNGGRVIAYMPQIVCVYRCQNGAAAVSLLTWIMFTASNAATVT